MGGRGRHFALQKRPHNLVAPNALAYIATSQKGMACTPRDPKCGRFFFIFLDFGPAISSQLLLAKGGGDGGRGSGGSTHPAAARKGHKTLTRRTPKTRTCAPCPHHLSHHFGTLSPSLVPVAHLVPLACGTTYAPCPHHLWYTFSPSLITPLVRLVPITCGTICAPCPHRQWSHLRTLSPSLMVPLAHLPPSHCQIKAMKAPSKSF